jgi:hypothetical protein
LKKNLKLRTEVLFTGVRVLTPSFAFAIFIVIGALRHAPPLKLALASLLLYIFFSILSDAFVRVLRKLYFEVTDVDRGIIGDESTIPAKGQLIDIKQSAEMPRYRR